MRDLYGNGGSKIRELCFLFTEKEKEKKRAADKEIKRAEQADNVLGTIYLTFPSFLLPHSMGDWPT